MAEKVRIHIDIFGDEAFRRRLTRIAWEIQDFRPAWGGVLKVLHRSTREQFSSRGRGAWRPLSPKYASWKSRRYPGKPLMRRTDALYNSLKGRTGDSIISRRKLGFEWGTKLVYAKYHQEGSRLGGLPQRKVVDLTIQDKLDIINVLRDYAEKVTGRRFI